MSKSEQEALDQIKYGLSKRDFHSMKGHLHFARATLLIGDTETAIEKISEVVDILDNVFVNGELPDSGE